MLAYHWHPTGLSHITTPHLHLEQGARVGFEALSRVHLPTGFVSFPDFVRLAIDLGARPLRRNWERLLSEAASELADTSVAMVT